MENNLAEILKTARIEKGLTLQKVAESVGCSASYINRIENNQRKGINYEIKEKLFDLYEIEIGSSQKEKISAYLDEIRTLIDRIEKLL